MTLTETDFECFDLNLQQRPNTPDFCVGSIGIEPFCYVSPHFDTFHLFQDLREL